MSTINIFKCYESTYDNGLDEDIKEFEKFVRRVESEYRPHNISFEFHEYSEYYDYWIENDTIDSATFLRDGYFQIMSEFNLVLGIYANMSEEWPRKEIKIFREYIKIFRDLNLCTMFLSNADLTPEMATIKSELAEEIGDNYVDARSLGEIKFNFMMQLRGLSFHDDTRLMVDGSSIKFGEVYVCGVSEIPFLEGCEERAQQIIDALSFAMFIRHKNDCYKIGRQMVKLLKQHQNDGVAKLFNYEDINAQITDLIDRYTENKSSQNRSAIRILLDKLKLFALNALVLEGDSAESRRLHRGYYTERYEAAVSYGLPIYDVAPALLDYIELLQDEDRKVTLMEECVARHINTEYIASSHRESVRIEYYLDFMQDKIIRHYEKAKRYDMVEQICLSEIERERKEGCDFTFSRSQRLYSKLGAIYEANITGRECVLA